MKKLANIDKENKFLQKHEEEIVQKLIFDEQIIELEGMINEKDAKINDLVQRVNEVEAKNSALEKSFSDKTIILEERLDTIEKKKTETIPNNINDEKIKTFE